MTLVDSGSGSTVDFGRKFDNLRILIVMDGVNHRERERGRMRYVRRKRKILPQP